MNSVWFSPNGSGGTSTVMNQIDVGGQAFVYRADIADSRPRKVRFAADMSGQTVRRDEEDMVYHDDPHELWYRFAGKERGYLGNNSTLEPNYTGSITRRTMASDPWGFRDGAATPHADFDQSIAPINSYYQGGAGGSYTVRTGDTLASIAAALWGDGALWYRLAEANGLTANTALIEGQVLTIPPGVMRNTHNAATFSPYDPAATLGDISPTSSYAPPGRKGCGAIDGVTRRDFELTVDGERVPGILWTPEGAVGPRPLILFGHGGAQSRRAENINAVATIYARQLGYACAAIDAPNHGDRPRRAMAPGNADAASTIASADARWQATRTLAADSDKVVAEWKATLNALQELDMIGADGPVGYWGVSMGTLFGVPFVAHEPRITCAVFGLFGVIPGLDAHKADAARITIPLMFTFQWNDEMLSRDQGIALFDAFGSAEKTMHINPGGHAAIPKHEREAWRSFWRRHLGDAR